MTRAPKVTLQFIRFVVVGALNTLLGLAVIFMAKGLLDWNDLASNVAGYSFGLCLSFLLNRGWTFRHKGEISPTLLRFLCAFALAYGSNLITVFALRDLAGLNSYVAQAAGIAPYTLLFFAASRMFVFPNRPAG
jgi:putative flippase GtrA